MSFFDLILGLLIIGFALFGVWFGLIHTLGSLLGTILGIFLASRFYQPLSIWLIKITGWGDNVASVIMFAVAFLIINRLIGLAFFLVERFFRALTKLPFLNSLNRILGLLFGFFEGVIFLGTFFLFYARFPFGASLRAGVESSRLIPFITRTASVVWPLVPQALRSVESTIRGIM
ncbi:MAG: CvpA family protein [Candidatus Magasanikbacteria bacterium]|nr:CvpA family protein [Candidatus Magasanikbacteria bacterium]